MKDLFLTEMVITLENNLLRVMGFTGAPFLSLWNFPLRH